MPGKWKAQLGPEKIEGFGPELGEDKNWSRFQKCVGNQRTISLYNPEIPFRSFDNFLEFNLDGLLPLREIHYFVFCIAELDNVGTRFSAYIRLDYRGSIRWLCFSPAPELKSYKDFTNPQQHRETIFPARLNVGDKKLNVINLSDVKETLRQAWATDSVNVDDCYVSGLRFRGAFSLSFAGLAR
jgi:hypothetical protein